MQVSKSKESGKIIEFLSEIFSLNLKIRKEFAYTLNQNSGNCHDNILMYVSNTLEVMS